MDPKKADKRNLSLLVWIIWLEGHVDSLLQDCSNSIANALKLL